MDAEVGERKKASWASGRSLGPQRPVQPAGWACCLWKQVESSQVRCPGVPSLPFLTFQSEGEIWGGGADQDALCSPPRRLSDFCTHGTKGFLLVLHPGSPLAGLRGWYWVLPVESWSAVCKAGVVLSPQPHVSSSPQLECDLQVLGPH